MLEAISAAVKTADYMQRPANEQLTARQAEQAAAAAAKEEGGGRPEPEEQPLKAESVQQAVHKMNKTLETYGTELRFQLHEKSGEYIVKIINTKDHSVIREIPPERVLNMVAYFKEMLGLVVDKFA
ncbi:Flagellar protein FlaG protein [Desulforamulus hydrothermalis Lam5 = DSM 18033]|uniref:Flagellar protein FlaG protein n=1 Tax=Desulforamulus hydrothermalis Lam5 = DSM 18033 TaxID=1121428 RepID=K8EKU0_9FIRM|nr:flagellar protein FlaG [Desulforamulus hydrothermalis]CCO09156.1 Flagellar protein FlaG protein [Desulforamulus hydrothermalis Lam5 = DSM 18033]SHH11539.1 flagellar protein FlaG [Desulforamulus hydrothermalis Lam5 = DSM 18033]